MTWLSGKALLELTNFAQIELPWVSLAFFGMLTKGIRNHVWNIILFISWSYKWLKVRKTRFNGFDHQIWASKRKPTLYGARSGGSGRKMTNSGPVSGAGMSQGSNSSGHSMTGSEWFSWFAHCTQELGQKIDTPKLADRLFASYLKISSSLVEKLGGKKQQKKTSPAWRFQIPSLMAGLWSKSLEVNQSTVGPKDGPNKMGRNKNARPLCVLEQPQMHEELTYSTNGRKKRDIGFWRES